MAIAAPTSKTVLLTGETGTGKTQLARVIHDNSPRHRGPFVEVSCTNLPDGIVESELFGAKRGAATDVDRDRAGLRGPGGARDAVPRRDRRHAARGAGGAAPAAAVEAVQPARQPGCRSRPTCGSSPAPTWTCGAPWPTAKFRQDLLYRLDVITIRMPSLAERREDIRELAEFFCAEECRKEGSPRELSREALRALEAAEWPGNVRDLSNAVARGVLRAMADGTAQVERRHVFPDVSRVRPVAAERAPTYEEAVNRFKAQLLRDTLEQTGWNVAETAKRLDLARSHLYNLIGALGIERERRP